MSQLNFQLDFLDGIVGTLRRMAGDHEDMARSLHNHASSAQSIGADGWIVDQVRFAASILSGHPDLFYQLSSELDHRLQIAHSVADEWQGATTGLRVALTGALTATTGLLAHASMSTKVNQTAQKTEKKVPAEVPQATLAIARARAIGLKGMETGSQYGSSYLSSHDLSDGGLATSTGGNNCGPASLATAINYFVHTGRALTGTHEISPLQAASDIRGGATHNVTGANGTTDFGLGTYPTSGSSRDLLAKYGLQLESVAGYDDVKKQLDAGHPVVILVNNGAYAGAGTSGAAANIYGGATDVQPVEHIIVVAGYDKDHVYIDDPLSRDPKTHQPLQYFPIKVEEFRAAAGSWYGAAVTPAERLGPMPIAGHPATLKAK